MYARKRYENITFALVWVAALSAVILFVSGNAYAASDSDYTLNHWVKTSETTLNDKRAFNYYLGSGDNQFCDVTFTIDLIAQSPGATKTGVTFVSEKNNNIELDVSCSWLGEYFVQSSKYQTSTAVELVRGSEGLFIKVQANLLSTDDYTLNRFDSDYILVTPNEEKPAT